jgi:hypothetical protein
MSAPTCTFLMDALRDVAALDRNGTRCYCDAFASGSTRHTERCAEIAKAVSEPTAPAPYRPPMGWEERARRAEICAEDLAGALSELLPLVADRFKRDVARLSLDRWTAHRADLDTLEQAQEGR